MLLPATKKLMEFLRVRNKLIRKNNLNISDWASDYLNRCFINGKPVSILTQWCLSKDLEERYGNQRDKVVPTKKERKLFETEIPQIISTFLENGFRLNWWITFNRSYLDSGRIVDRELENQYKAMITGWYSDKNLLFLDWEEDILGNRPAPDNKVLNDFWNYISNGAFGVEFKRHSNWAKGAGLKQTDEELKRDVKFQIACESNEGNFLLSEQSPFPFGDFILIPLEVPERYDFFVVFAKDFKQRIVSVLPFYPWRLKE